MFNLVGSLDRPVLASGTSCYPFVYRPQPMRFRHGDKAFRHGWEMGRKETYEVMEAA